MKSQKSVSIMKFSQENHSNITPHNEPIFDVFLLESMKEKHEIKLLSSVRTHGTPCMFLIIEQPGNCTFGCSERITRIMPLKIWILSLS